MVLLKMLSILKKLATKLLLKAFSLPDKAVILRPDFRWSLAAPGSKLLRTCAVVYHPCCPPPYTKDNWMTKICAIVVFRLKIFSFTAMQATAY